MVARYEDGKILCRSRGVIQQPRFCEDHAACPDIHLIEPKGDIKPVKAPYVYSNDF
jgi:hypothetical protein